MTLPHRAAVAVPRLRDMANVIKKDADGKLFQCTRRQADTIYADYTEVDADGKPVPAVKPDKKES